MENQNQTPHKRRVRYKGKYPKKFEEKNKELQTLLSCMFSKLMISAAA